MLWADLPESLDPLPGESLAGWYARVAAYDAANPGVLTPLNAANLNALESKVEALSVGAISSLEAAGDSWVAGFGVTNSAFSYVSRLAKSLGGVTATNLGVSGAGGTGTLAENGLPLLMRAASLAPTLTAGPYFSKGGLKVAQVGYNDQTVLGSVGAGAIAVTESCLKGYFAMLRAARIIAADDAAVTEGPGVGGAGDATLCFTTGYSFMNANAQYIDFVTDAAYAGDPITTFHPFFAAFATTGTLTFRLNPAGANTLLGTLDGPTLDAALKAPVTDRAATCCFRIPRGVVPAGVNTIRMVASGLSGANFATFTGAVIEGKAPLLLPLYKAQDASLNTQIAWANQRIINVAAGLDNADTVDLALFLNDPRYFFDVAHPNNLGNARVAGALIGALPSVLTLENMGEMS